MVPVFLLAERRKLVVARVEPEDVASDGLWTHTVDDDADELAGFAAPDIHLIAGAQIDAAVVKARFVFAGIRLMRTDELGGALGAVLGEHEVELQLDVLELRLRHQTAASLTWIRPSPRYG